MTNYAAVLPHGDFQEVFPNVFFITGTTIGMFSGTEWQFSRNMTVVRDGDSLSLINSVRLDDEGLAKLDALGNVKNVVQIGSLHGMDDAFYIDRYDATFWAMPGMPQNESQPAYKELGVNAQYPFPDCSVFSFKATNLPEGILRINREGGIMIACDALQNWIQEDEFFSESSIKTMHEMGFFQKANVGPVWMQMNDPKAEDFVRLKELEFKHALCGHGEPLLNTAAEDYAKTFERLFNI